MFIIIIVVVVAVFVIITIFFFENKGKIANSFSQSYMGIRYILPTLYCSERWSLSEVLSYPLNIERKMGLELPSGIFERFNAEKSDTRVSQGCLLRYLSLPSHLIYAHSKGQNEEGPRELS